MARDTGNFEIQFRPGKEHTNADTLSRLPHIEKMPGVEDDSPDSIQEIHNISDSVNSF